MTVPIQFLWLSLGVLVILLPLTVYMATSGLRDRQVHLWCGGSLAMEAGFILVSFRDHISPLLSFNVSQLLVICGYVVRTYALRFDSMKSTARSESIIRRYTVIFTLYYLVYCWMVYLQTEERIRLIVVYAFQVCLAIDLYSSSKTEGMGIGLWLTRNILESHEATIIADPTYHGGAKFLLTFKLAPALAEA